MKIFRAIAAVAFVAAISAGSISAQTRPAGTPATSTAPTQTMASVPDSKIALIDSAAFGDEKQGIVKIVTALKKLNAEFQPRQTELQTLQQQIDKATLDLQKVQPVQDAKLTARCFNVWTVEEMLNPERRFVLTSADFALLNPNARTLTIPAAGHAAHLEQSEALASAVLEFLGA